MNISNALSKFFKFEELNTNLKTELVAGVTTFATLAYIMIVIPNIMSGIGMPQGAVTSTIIYMAFVGCMLMGLIANRPFAVAPLLAEYVFLAYTVVPMFGEGEWQKAFGAVVIAAITLFVLTICNVRVWLVNCLPACLKFAFTAGLGLYLAFVGLKGAGIINVTDNYRQLLGYKHIACDCRNFNHRNFNVERGQSCNVSRLNWRNDFVIPFRAINFTRILCFCSGKSCTCIFKGRCSRRFEH